MTAALKMASIHSLIY